MPLAFKAQRSPVKCQPLQTDLKYEPSSQGPSVHTPPPCLRSQIGMGPHVFAQTCPPRPPRFALGPKIFCFLERTRVQRPVERTTWPQGEAQIPALHLQGRSSQGAPSSSLILSSLHLTVSSLISLPLFCPPYKPILPFSGHHTLICL